MPSTPRAWFVPVLLAVAACGRAPEPEPTAAVPEKSTYERASDAYLSQDYDTFVALMEEVVEANPDSNRDRYNLACGYALAGRRDDAIEELSVLLSKGVDFGVAADPDFESLHDHEAFQRIVAAYDRLYPPISTSVPVETLPMYDLFPDGMAYDPASDAFFVGSLRYGQVHRAGSAEPFAKLEADGVPYAALGMQVDRGLLWVAGSHYKVLAESDPAHLGRAGVFAFDLATGEPRHTVLAGPETKGFNDLAVSASGDVYMSGPGLYHLAPGAGSLTPVALDPPFDRTNGITFGEDDETLYVADAKGIARVDLSDRSWSWVAAPEGERIHGFESLYWADGSLVGIQHGLGRWRAVQLSLNEDGNLVTDVRVIEQSNPKLLAATTGAVDGETFYYLARSPVPDDAVDQVEPGFRGLASQPVILSASLQPPAAFTSTTP